MRKCLGSKHHQENAFALLLRQCRDLESGRSLHATIFRSGLLHSSTFLSNLLIQMYGACSSPADALAVFTSINTRNIFSWNILLAAHARSSSPVSALQIFAHMNSDGTVRPNDFTLATVLGACSTLGHLTGGIMVHACVRELGLESDAFVGTALITMYGKCRMLDRAVASFRSITRPDLVAWNAIIAAGAQNGHSGSSLAVGFFLEMIHGGIRPDSVSLLGLISACASLDILAIPAAFHEHVLLGMLSGNEAQNALLNLYARCGCVGLAEDMFDRISEKDVFSWTGIISAFSNVGKAREAFGLFQKMAVHGVQPQAPTFAVVSSACCTISQAKVLHACAAEAGLESDLVVGTAMINMYSSLVSLENARRVFEKLTVKDSVAWNTILEACWEDGKFLFCCMDLEGVKPDSQTFMSRIESCSRLGDSVLGRKIHERIVSCGYGSCDEILTALIDMYSKCGSVENAKQAFDHVREKNVVAWTAIVSAFAQNGYISCGLQLFQIMELEGVEPDLAAFVSGISACPRLEDLKHMHARVADVAFTDPDRLVIGTALVSRYGSFGSVSDAFQVFSCIPCRDSVAFNAMSSVFVDNECYAAAICLYTSMEDEQVQLSLVTIVNAINSCTSLGELKEGRKIHRQLDDAYQILYPVVVSALINMYGRCGCLSSAQELFDGPQKRTLWSWNCMVDAYAQHGHLLQSLELFREMQLYGLLPDKTTYISLLQAFSHGGMVSEGRVCFLRMGMDHGLIPVIEHYVCMVDMFGRVGQLDAAEHLVSSLPFEPDAAVWNSLLGACNLQGDMKRAERSADCAVKIEVEAYAAPYVLLSNLYAAAGRWEDVASVRKAMADRGIRKPGGRSFQCI